MKTTKQLDKTNRILLESQNGLHPRKLLAVINYKPVNLQITP